MLYETWLPAVIPPSGDSPVTKVIRCGAGVGDSMSLSPFADDSWIRPSGWTVIRLSVGT